MSSNGYSWSDSRSQDNIKKQGFIFSTGDIVEVIFNPLKNCI